MAVPGPFDKGAALNHFKESFRCKSSQFYSLTLDRLSIKETVNECRS